MATDAGNIQGTQEEPVRIEAQLTGPLSIEHTEAMRRWSGRRYVVDGNAMTVQGNCHYEPQEGCITGLATADERTTDWGPQNVVF